MLFQQVVDGVLLLPGHRLGAHRRHKLQGEQIRLHGSAPPSTSPACTSSACGSRSRDGKTSASFWDTTGFTTQNPPRGGFKSALLLRIQVQLVTTRTAATEAARPGCSKTGSPAASGRLVLNVLASVSQWEREGIGERTAAALAFKRSKGEVTGGRVPCGFRLSDDGVRLIKNDEEQAAIRETRKRRIQGWSLRRVGRSLAAAGFASRSGTTFGAKQIARLFGGPLMSRNDKRRQRVRKKRRQAQRATAAGYEDRGLGIPRQTTPNETRNPRTRWLNLTPRGGHTMSFIPTGVTVPIDLDAPGAENTLVSALAGRMCPEAGES